MQAGPRKGKGGLRGKAAERGGPLALTGWVLFDWATQPFYTLVVTFLFGPYFVNGFIRDPALGATLWAYATGGAVLVAGFIVADPDTGKTVLGLDPIMPVDAATRADERLVGPFSALWYLIFVLPLFLFTPDRPG